MRETISYPLRLPILSKLFVPGALIFMLVVGVYVMVPQYPDPSTIVFSVAWFGIIGYMIIFTFSLPLQIVHHPDDTLEFRSPLRKRLVSVHSLTAVEPVPNQFGFFYFRHGQGKITVLIHFDGFHRLIGSISQINPGVRLLGC